MRYVDPVDLAALLLFGSAALCGIAWTIAGIIYLFKRGN